jgi:hypothetical protein
VGVTEPPFDIPWLISWVGAADYLEYKFGTVKCYNGRNNFIIPHLIQIPYYVFLGASRHRATLESQRKALPLVERLENEVSMTNGVLTPVSPWQDGSASCQKISGTPPELALGESGWPGEKTQEETLSTVSARLR